MEYLIIPTESLKEVDTEWMHRRKSNDESVSVIHKDIWDEITGYAVPLPLYSEEVEYPLPIYTGEQINEMAEFKSVEEL